MSVGVDADGAEVLCAADALDAGGVVVGSISDPAGGDVGEDGGGSDRI